MSLKITSLLLQSLWKARQRLSADDSNNSTGIRTAAPSDLSVSQLPLYGVNLPFLKKVLSYSALYDPDYELSVSQILEKIVIPITKSSKTSLAVHLKTKYREDLEPKLKVSYNHCISRVADAYVIYSRSSCYYDLVNCLECYAENNVKDGQTKNDIYFWIDIFSANQYVDITSNWLTAVNYKIIGHIGSTCLVMLPYENIEAYSRSWCLYELFIASLHKKKLNFLFKKSKYIQFESSIHSNVDFFKDTCCDTVSLAKSDCYSGSEHDLILSVLKDMHVDGAGGVEDAINRYIIDQFYDRCVASISKYLENLGADLLKIQNQYSTKSVCLNLFVEDDARDDTNINTVPIQLKEVAGLLSLASVHYERGDLEKAISTYEGLLRTHNHIVNVDHPSIGSVYNNLGILYKRLGNFDNSKLYFRKALRLKKALYGKLHESHLTTIINLAMLHKAMGKLQDALSILIQVYSDMEQLYGEKSRESIKVVELVIEIYIDLGQNESAISFLKLCLEMHLVYSGTMHIDTINIYETLGMLVAKCGEVQEGVVILEQTIASRQQISGAGHPTTLESTSRLAVLKLQQRNVAEAKALFTTVYDYISKGSSFDSLGRFCLETLGDINVQLKTFDDAIFFYEKGFESCRTLLGDHEDTYRLSYKLADTYITIAKYDQCEPLLKFSYEGRHKLLGDTHPHTLEAQFAYANSLVTQFRYTEAGVIYQSLLITFERLYGKDSSHAVDALDALGVIHTKRGNVEQAKDIYTRLISHFERDGTKEAKFAAYYTKLRDHLFDKT